MLLFVSIKKPRVLVNIHRLKMMAGVEQSLRKKNNVQSISSYRFYFNRKSGIIVTILPLERCSKRIDTIQLFDMYVTFVLAFCSLGAPSKLLCDAFLIVGWRTGPPCLYNVACADDGMQVTESF